MSTTTYDPACPWTDQPTSAAQLRALADQQPDLIGDDDVCLAAALALEVRERQRQVLAQDGGLPGRVRSDRGRKGLVPVTEQEQADGDAVMGLISSYFKQTSEGLLAETARSYQLDHAGLWCLLAIVAYDMGLLTFSVGMLAHLQDLIALNEGPARRQAVARALRDNAPLIADGLLEHDGDERIRYRLYRLTPVFAAEVMGLDTDSAVARDKERSAPRKPRCGMPPGMQDEEAQRGEQFAPRAPKMRMEQLVLADGVAETLRVAVSSVAQRGDVLEDWGLAETIGYGRGTTMLFAGGPGLGKTAAAEAMAAELDCPIISVAYSQVQSRYFGECERNISAAFAAAREHGAVLFWDEIDALVLDRATADHQHYIGQTNTFLQELEQFEGVCILATNRADGLDPAIDRRLAYKQEFTAPEATQRAAIWRNLIPAAMPLADDVDLGALAEADLTGGEIKNAVLNAARNAKAGPTPDRVCRADFEQALALEAEGRGLREGGGPSVGFALD
ncbi:MAG: ATP-binding protein [Planctomycetota bacterium]|jgi:hypothetical protein